MLATYVVRYRSLTGCLQLGHRLLAVSQLYSEVLFLSLVVTARTQTVSQLYNEVSFTDWLWHLGYRLLAVSQLYNEVLFPDWL